MAYAYFKIFYIALANMLNTLYNTVIPGIIASVGKQ